MSELMGVKGHFHRVIKLDTSVEAACAYFMDFNHVLPRLPEVDRVLRYKDGRYRMIFMSDDGRGHEMGVVFDIRQEVLENRHVRMLPIPISRQELAGSPLATNAPLFPGTFNGETTFIQRDNHCEVVYKAALQIEIEVPRFLNFIPRNMLQKMGDGMMNFKLTAVGEGLGRNTPTDFKQWYKTNEEKLAGVLSETRHKVGVAVGGHEKNSLGHSVNVLKSERSGIEFN